MVRDNADDLVAMLNVNVEEGPLQVFPVEDPPPHGSRVEGGSATRPIEGHS